VGTDDRHKRGLAMRGLRTRPRERGQGIVEFAISMPFMLLILLGTIDMGRVFFDYIDMRQAAIEGATYGSRRPTDTAGITAAVKAHGLPADATITVATSGDCATPTGLGDVKVTASRVWTPISLDALKLVGADGDWSFTVNASSTMRCMT
jgi:Flp pilus assembly protein TadG